MSCLARASMLVGMTVTIWVYVNRTLSGRVAGDGGEAREFFGWLQLLSILNELVGTVGQREPHERFLAPVEERRLSGPGRSSTGGA